jgi:hypothetical protein
MIETNKQQQQQATTTFRHLSEVTEHLNRNAEVNEQVRLFTRAKHTFLLLRVQRTGRLIGDGSEGGVRQQPSNPGCDAAVRVSRRPARVVMTRADMIMMYHSIARRE